MSYDSVYPLCVPSHKLENGLAASCAEVIVRRCPVGERDSIIGHGRRRKQAHDGHHDWIGIGAVAVPVAGRPSPSCRCFLPLTLSTACWFLSGIAAALCRALFVGNRRRLR